jgi:predicted CopG family antitoxin
MSRKTLTVSEAVYKKLIEISSKESLKQKKRVSINDILERDYLKANSSTKYPN